MAEDINLIASQVSGELLAPSEESSTITINAGPPTVLTVEFSSDPELNDPVGNTSFRINDPADTLEVFAISRDSVGNFIAFETDATFSLVNLTGDLMESALFDNTDGSALFTASSLGTATIRATLTGFPDGDSGQITVEEPQFRWTGGNGSWGAAGNWLDGISPFAVQDPPVEANTIDLFFYDEYTSPNQLFLNGNRTVRSLNFTEFVDPTVAGGFGIRYLQNNTEGVGRSLTIDTDSLEDPAELNVDAGAEANIDMGNVNNGFIPDNSVNYGDTILADPLLITHQGTGILVFSRPIAETGGSMGVTIDASSTGTVNFIATNTYTGPTTVNGGILRLNGDSIADAASLVIGGGMVNVQADERLQFLSIDGGLTNLPDGEYGSTDSGVDNPDDTNFSGPGRIIVGPPPAVEEITITSIDKTGPEEITIAFTSDGPVDVYGSTEDNGFVWTLFDEDIPSGSYVDAFASLDRIFYILVTADGDPPADSP